MGRALARALALESREPTLAGLLEATVAMSAIAHEGERWEAVLRRLVSS